jgi:hypothetical protein
MEETNSFGSKVKNAFRAFGSLFVINHNPGPMETPEKKEPASENEVNKIVENISTSANQNVKNVMASFKRIGIGYKRLFTAVYILGLGTLLFWLLNKYGLLETFVTYLAAFTVFYWLLVALFIWVRDGFVKKDQ